MSAPIVRQNAFNPQEEFPVIESPRDRPKRKCICDKILDCLRDFFNPSERHRELPPGEIPPGELPRMELPPQAVNIDLRADPIPLPVIVRPKKVDDKRKNALPENQENREILLIIQNNYLKTSVQRIEEEFKRGLQNVNIRIFQENQLMDDLLPKVPFLAFNIIFNGGCPNLPKINSKQSEVFRLCKENCVIVLLSRSKNQNVEKIIQTGISSKDGIKRYAIAWQMNRSVGDQMSESAVKHLSEQMRNIFNDYLRFKK